jgi:hypothetical protein
MVKDYLSPRLKRPVSEAAIMPKAIMLGAIPAPSYAFMVRKGTT